MTPTYPRLCGLIALLCSPAFAEDTRQLGAHEHGVGAVNIAVEDTRIALELRAPGADIVGFEYAAKSAEDRAAIDEAVARLARPLDLFVFPAAAECTVTQASAVLESEAAHEGHNHDAYDHAGHDHDAQDHEEHAHDHDTQEAGGHTEFHAEYLLTCNTPGAISPITFAYFDAFENARMLNVQLVSASGARAAEVTRDAPVLDLRGMF